MSDIPKPVKEKFPEVCEAEDKLIKTIYSKFIKEELSDDELEEIDKIDSILLNEEFIAFKQKPIEPNIERVKSEIYLEEKPFAFYKEKFLSRFFLLNGSDNDIKQLEFQKGENHSYVGIDGCGGKGGMWLVVELNHEGYEVRRLESIEQLNQIYNCDDDILIDVPIGLPDDLDSLKKRPDSKLRKELKGKSSSVFNTPFRSVLYETDKDVARARSKEIGKGISAQSLAIGKYIRDIDTFLQKNEEYKNVIMESHPEYCFKMLNNGIPVLSKKSKIDGLIERKEILSMYYAQTDELLKYGTAKYGNNKKIKGDILDALCLAICAKIGSENGYATIPESPFKDQNGLKMQIVYPLV